MKGRKGSNEIIISRGAETKTVNENANKIFRNDNAAMYRIDSTTN
jgi:hypothetical protein